MSDASDSRPDYVELARSFGLTKIAYSVEDTADLLSRSRDFIDDLISRGDLKASKVSNRVSVLAVEIARLLHAGEIDPSTRRQPKPREHYGRKPKRVDPVADS
jgi:hypothetical protein